MRWALVVIGIIILVAVAAFTIQPTPETWSLSPTGLLVYSGVTTPAFEMTDLTPTDKKVVFTSRGQEIHALFSLPAETGVFPVFVILPGGNVRKEDEHANLGKDLRDLGFATLTLDQRGIGETGGPFPPFDQQIIAMANNNEPTWHLMIADAIHAARIAKSMKNTDPERVYLAGVSMGGQVGIVAAAQDPTIQGVIAISTGGFALPEGVDRPVERFFDSINPDYYAGAISPRPLVMMHAEDDTIISFAAAQQLFSRAKEPKQFFTSESGHGYYPSSRPILEQVLQGW